MTFGPCNFKGFKLYDENGNVPSTYVFSATGKEDCFVDVHVEGKGLVKGGLAVNIQTPHGLGWAVTLDYPKPFTVMVVFNCPKE